jgi:glucokinase
MLLAGDVGGTKALLGLFERGATRPLPVFVHAYATGQFDSFDALLNAFTVDACRPLYVEAVAIGVAGPVIAGIASLTNGAWAVPAEEMSARCRTSRVALLNDVSALAACVPVLADDEIEVLQDGTPDPEGNAVVIAAGTGLGEATLHRVRGTLVPLSSEGGHADFGPRSDREVELVRLLLEERGRVEVEQVVSGAGLTHFYRLTHASGPCPIVDRVTPNPAAVTESAMAGRCPFCVEALDLFVSAYGSAAGCLALRGVATAGVFVGGGIALKILQVLRRGGFMEAFREKPPMTGLLTRMPVKVIVNPEAGLCGAAVVAASLA